MRDVSNSGIVVNPRGTSGSGKTELVRRILAQYGWRRTAESGSIAGFEPFYGAGRRRPMGYRLHHPRSGRPLAVIGHYEVTSGGCDTIRAGDGGLEEALALAADHASAGYDVILEGLRLSAEQLLSSKLAERHSLHVLRLTTPLEQCARNLASRRRMRRDSWPALAKIVARQYDGIAEACDSLADCAKVEALGFADAFGRAQALLGLAPQEDRWLTELREQQAGGLQHAVAGYSAT